MKIKFHDEYYKILDFEIPQTYHEFIQILSEVVSPEPLPPSFHLRYRDIEDFPIKVSNQRTYNVMLEEKKNSQNELILFLTSEEKNEDFGDMSNIQNSSFDHTTIHVPPSSYLNYAAGNPQYQTLNPSVYILEPKKEEPGVHTILIPDTPSSTVEGSFGHTIESLQRDNKGRFLPQAYGGNGENFGKVSEHIQKLAASVIGNMTNMGMEGIQSDGFREALSERIDKAVSKEKKGDKESKEKKEKKKKEKKSSEEKKDKKDKKDKVDNSGKSEKSEKSEKKKSSSKDKNQKKDKKEGTKTDLKESKEGKESATSKVSTRNGKRSAPKGEEDAEEEKLEVIEKKKKQTVPVRSTNGGKKTPSKKVVEEEESEDEDDEDEEEDEKEKGEPEKWRKDYLVETDFEKNSLKVAIIIKENPEKPRYRSNRRLTDENVQTIMKELVEKLGGRSVSHERPVIKDLSISFRDCKKVTKVAMLSVFQTITEDFKYVHTLNLDFSYGRYQHKFTPIEGEIELDLRHLQELNLNLRFRPDIAVKEIDGFIQKVKKKSRNLQSIKVIKPLRPE